MLVPPGNGRSSVVAAGFKIPTASIERPWPITFRVHFALVQPRADRVMARMPTTANTLNN
ncbi:hypothetical protein MAB47J26_03975 [Mycobacteroides abscessus 47J26]|nr:hypothetical protein MYCMA_07155 [Mycobacteroides abscessus subsp. massiliense str. GO 06]EHC00640.1 hypothetical protein MAB47J26_03975 [Mycobacteroides abscessus 47J26]